MKRIGTVDLEILFLAIKENGSFNEKNLENSELKRLGVGRILDALASLKDRKMIALNSSGSFSITDIAREILWSRTVPTWVKILRLLQIKSCNITQITEILKISEDIILKDIELLRKNQLVLMSPQRQDEKLVKVYEILPEGIEELDKTETEGFKNIKFTQIKAEIEIMDIIEEISNEVNDSHIEQSKKERISKKIAVLKEKLEI